MSTDLDTRPDLLDGDSAEEGDHIVCCCSRDISLCGKDVTENEYVDDFTDDDHTCQRCLALESVPCILCGHGNASCYCGKCGK